MRIVASFFYSVIILLSCAAPTKIVKYEEQKNEFYSNPNLQDLLKTNHAPKIVLRVGKFNFRSLTDNSTQKNLDYLYNAMENELIRQGFSVKDRSTFNEFVSRTNSSELLKKELSDADLVLEVVNLDDNVPYTTNNVSTLKNKVLADEKSSLQYTSRGAYVEYRFIVVKNNEIGGTYKFYYRPCAHGCPLDKFKYTRGKENEMHYTQELTKEALQEFISTSIQELIYTLQLTK